MSVLEKFVYENPSSLDLIRDNIKEKQVKKATVFKENCILSVEELRLFGLEDLYNTEEKVREKEAVEQSIADLTFTIEKLKEHLEAVKNGKSKNLPTESNVNNENFDWGVHFEEVIDAILRVTLLSGNQNTPYKFDEKDINSLNSEENVSRKKIHEEEERRRKIFNEKFLNMTFPTSSRSDREMGMVSSARYYESSLSSFFMFTTRAEIIEAIRFKIIPPQKTKESSNN